VAVQQVAGPSPQRIAVAYRRGAKQVPAAIRRGFQRALAPLDAEVASQVDDKFPSGYAPVFNASRKVTISLREHGAQVTAEARIYATGQTDRRKVTDLNRGLLRHPLFARRARWYAQAIPAGFGDQAVQATQPGISRAMNAVLDNIEQTLTGA
jgi:hypothetical protein